MKWIGLTGGIATGKSTVAKILHEAGQPVVDADVLSRKAVEKGSVGFQSVVKAFGPEVVGDDGELNRAKLAEVVFANPSELKKLEEIIHPFVQDLAQQKRRELEAQGFSLAFYDVPLLFEKGLQERFDATVVVICSPEVQRQRMAERDGLTQKQIAERVSSQLPQQQKIERSDFVIENNGGLVELKNKVLELIKKLETS